MRITKCIWGLILCLGFPGCLLAQAEDLDLFGTGQASPAAQAAPVIPPAAQVIWSGTLDFRAIRTGESLNWQEGGPGLSRYGGVVKNRTTYTSLLKGEKAVTTFKMPQASLVAEILWQGQPRAHIQLNYDDLYDLGRSNGRLGIVEAFLMYDRKFAGGHLESRFGLLIPPISHEHPDTAWSTRYTITPSAINAWVGEELRPTALEIKYQRELTSFSRVEWLIAPFAGNDPAAALLSWRGWAMHDYQYTLGTRLKYQQVTPLQLAPEGGWEQPHKELDGNLGVYTRFGLTLDQRLKIQWFYSDSMADHHIKDSQREYAWTTRFANVALEWTPTDNLFLLAQALGGETLMGTWPTRSGVDNDYYASFFLVSYQIQEKHRLSLRFDKFGVIDRDHNLDRNDSSGQAITTAYMWRANEASLIGIEHLHLESQRVGNEGYQREDDPEDDLTQLMYRLIF